MGESLLQRDLQRVVAEVADVAPGVGHAAVLRESYESLSDGCGGIAGVCGRLMKNAGC